MSLTMLRQKIVMTLKKFTPSKYYDIEEMYNIEIPHKNESLSLLLIKISMAFNIS